MDAPKTVSWSAIAGGVSARPRDVISGLLGDFSEPKTAKESSKKVDFVDKFFLLQIWRDLVELILGVVTILFFFNYFDF